MTTDKIYPRIGIVRSGNILSDLDGNLNWQRSNSRGIRLWRYISSSKYAKSLARRYAKPPLNIPKP